MTISEWLHASVESLIAISDSPRLDVEIILSYVLERDRSYLYTWPEKELSKAQRSASDACLSRRQKSEPIAYIVGEKEFWSLPFYVEPSTLIPRPDTELLVESALALMSEAAGRVLDLGTGTGAIAIALASERPGDVFVGVDKSPSAVALAKRNASRNNIANVSFQQSDWFSNLSGCFDFIVSNPPYIDSDDPHLACGELKFEPTSALVADDKGLADIQHIVFSSICYLNEGGWLAIEHGWQQKNPVQNIFQTHGYSNIETHRDYGGNDRVTLGRRP